MTLAERIKLLRTSHELTQDQFGELCDSTKSAVSQWEGGTTQPTLTNLMALQSKLAFSLDWLVTGEGQEPGGNHEARRLIELYSALDKRGRAAVFRVAEAESAYSVEDSDLQKSAG